DIEVPIEEVAEAQLLGHRADPTPEAALALADELEWILGKLDSSARQVLELRLQGVQRSEIAQHTGRSERTVGRVLARVRDLLVRQRDDPGPLLSHHDFLLQRMIGAGRMGKVYEAWQHSEKRPVAVKYLRKSLLFEPFVVGRFIGEARIVARLA